MNDETQKKQQRLAAWRKRQEQAAAAATTGATTTTTAVEVATPAPAVHMTFKLNAQNKQRKSQQQTMVIARKKKKSVFSNPLLDENEKEDSPSESILPLKRPLLSLSLDEDNVGTNSSNSAAAAASASVATTTTNSGNHAAGPLKKRRRWDTSATSASDPLTVAQESPLVATVPVSAVSSTATTFASDAASTTAANPNEYDGEDALDKFMDQLQATAVDIPIALNSTTTSAGKSTAAMPLASASSSSIGSATTATSWIDASGSVMRRQTPKGSLLAATKTTNATTSNTTSSTNTFYQPSDWLSDAVPTDNEETEDEDDEAEEEKRRAVIQALLGGQQATSSTAVTTTSSTDLSDGTGSTTLSTKASAQAVREERLSAIAAAAAATQAAQRATVQDLGRDFFVADEDGVMEEATRLYEAAQAESANATTALYLLAEQLNKKKELVVQHDTVDYVPLVKNLYRVPPSLAALTHDAIINRRAQLKVRVRGTGAPAPVESFAQTGLPSSILNVLSSQNISTPFAIQAQCIPCIMAGRDVIGIAKTGSGKTLAYALPLLRHVLAQPPLERHESGPMALILAPARELAVQIHSVCKQFAKPLGLRSTVVYGGAGVAEQIADMKRGTHVVTATPGRLIDILTMQSGKVLSLQRVTFVVLDEADRMFDMGFAPQITAVLAAIRPDRQIVLFSATFPKAIETLARKSLKYPVEIMVGGRSVTSDNVTQYAELVEEEDKFLRLLQILGEHVEGTAKGIVFVDTQVRADHLFEHLLRNGYSTLSLHGGKDQEDRDSTISDFKRKDGPNVLVATGVAGRGLDVPACVCVVNYSAPNHLEAYVHQTGRTGRASNKGVCFTLVNSTDEAKFAPVICRALSEAGQAEHIDAALKVLSDDFKAKVEKGEAKYAGNGFKGKGYSYDSNEMTEAQRITQLEKRQALIEAGLLDPDKEDPLLMADLGGTGANTTASAKSNEGAPGKNDKAKSTDAKSGGAAGLEIPENLTPELLALPGMKEALLRKAGINVPASDSEAKAQGDKDPSLGYPVQTADNHWVQEFEINDYPREARWKVTQKETTSRMQDEFRTAVTLKGSYFPPGKEPTGPGDRKIYLHLEATSGTILRNAVLEIQRLLNEETLRISVRAATGGGSGPTSHKYNVLG